MTQTRNHKYYEALIPAYAIGAADEDDSRGLEAHLASCQLCCARLQDYQDLERSLLFSAAPVAAPFGMTEDLRLRIAAPPRQDAALGRHNRSRALAHPLAWLGFAVVALLVLSNVYWAGRVDRIERETAVLAAIVEAPGIPLQPSADLTDGRGVLYLPAGANRGLLCVYDLPALPGDSTYQAWLVSEGRRTNAGTFRVNDAGYGVLLIRSDRPLEEFDSLGITVEPAGGSPAPTTPRLMGGQL